MSRWNLGWLLGIPAVALLGLAVSQSAPVRERNQDYELIRLFVDALGEVEHKYVRSLDDDGKRKFVEEAINGALERLDPHSSYINPKEYEQFKKQSKGKFGGVGIQISPDRQTGQISVISPMVGTPAYEAGILAGDLIVKIDGHSTENMRLAEAVERIQGDPGQEVTLTVIHEGSREPVDVSMKRAEIVVQSVMGDLRKPGNAKEWDYFIDKANKIGYIRVTAFSDHTARDLREALEQLTRDGLRGLILDLRGNPGGLLRSAVEVSDMFLTEGKIVSTKGRNKQEEVYEAKPEGTLLLPARDYPIAVLVNKYSASASEIVSAALQDHKRAVIVGERSYGKGSVQNIIELKEPESKTSALKLTTASYWRPSGKNIHRFPDAKETDEWGVKPDAGFEVTLKDDERYQYMINRRDRDIVYGKDGASAPPKPVAKDKGKDAKDKTPTIDRTLLDDAVNTVLQRIDKDKKLVVDRRAMDEAITEVLNRPEKETKKPFADRVLEKALEYVRGELKKTVAAN